HLPLAIPRPLATGAPGEGYPLPWSIYTWLPGADAATARVDDLLAAARDLASFLGALRRLDTAGGLSPGAHNYFRGVPLAVRDTETRAAIVELATLLNVGLEHNLGVGLDLDAALAAWEAALQAPLWGRPPVWIHGDLAPLNF